MFQRRQKSFRHRPRGRTGSPRHSNGQGRSMSNNFSNGPMRNNFRGNTQSAEKLFEKYNTLAKEALSSGDKTLSENYFQHADHFTRVQNDQESNRLARVGTFPVDTKESSKNDEKNDELSKTDEIKTISTEPEVKKIIKSSEKKSVAS